MAKVISKTKSNKPVPKKPDMEKLKKEQEKAAKAKAKKEAGKKDAIAKTKTKIIDIIPPIAEADRKPMAVKHDARFRELEKAANSNFIEMAVILREFKQYELWKEVENKNGNAFKSFDSWLKDAAPTSRASGYAMLRAGEKLIPFIPQEELKQIPVRNMNLLSRIPKIHFEKPDSPIMKAAKGSEKDLRSSIEKHAPDAHIERQITIKIDASTAPVITDAVRAIQDLGLAGENDWLEYMSTSWLDSECELEMYAGMSNRDAARAHKQAEGAEDAGKELSREPINDVA